jgi:uncharacterized OB-fold protein
MNMQCGKIVRLTKQGAEVCIEDQGHQFPCDRTEGKVKVMGYKEQRCNSCGNFNLLSRHACEYCQSTDMRVVCTDVELPASVREAAPSGEVN